MPFLPCPATPEARKIAQAMDEQPKPILTGPHWDKAKSGEWFHVNDCLLDLRAAVEGLLKVSNQEEGR